MGRPRLAPAEKRTEVVKFRVCDEERRLLQRLSHLRGEANLSAIIRTALELLLAKTPPRPARVPF